MDYIADADWDGKAILEILKKELGLSSAHIKHLKFIPHGIKLNGAHATVRAKVTAGDTLSLALEDGELSEKKEAKLIPSDIPIDIIYEDEDVSAPNKPAEMPTHPSHGHYEDTLANALAFRYGSRFVFRPVNRLDRNTSGLVLIARNRRAAARLSDSMRRGDIGKMYLAVLQGELSEAGIIETYLRRTAESIILREVCLPEEGGDRAISCYAPIKVSGGRTLVLAAPVTGRTHQLRVHFAHIGCPIEGDDMYGSPSELIDRHALHAAMLSFPHPSNEGKEIYLEAPLFCDMKKLVGEIFFYDNDEALWNDMREASCVLKEYVRKVKNK